MTGKEILVKYPIDKTIASTDIWTGKSIRVPRWGKRHLIGGPWEVLMFTVDPQEYNKYPVINFGREVMVIILDCLLDPWGRPFKEKGIYVKKQKWKDVEVAEYHYYTTVEGYEVSCNVLVNPQLFYGSIIQGYKWNWL
jgi:hypothetical protein